MAMQSKDTALKTLVDAGDYWVVNWRIVKYFGGVDEAILIGYFCSMQKLYGNDVDAFYRTIPCVAADTTFEARRQRKAIKNLKDIGVLETANAGLPRKRYFRVNYAALDNFLQLLKEHY